MDPVSARDTTPMRIVVDSNEAIPTHRGYRFAGDELMKLDCADYTARDLIDTLRIERKSLPDFLGCCGSRRQEFERGTLAKMGVYPHRYLVLEFSLPDLAAGKWKRPKVHPSSAIGSLFGWTVRYGVHPILAGDAAHARSAVIRIVSLLLRQQSAEP